MNTRPKSFHGILTTSIATLFTLTAARAVDYNFGSITENFTLTATDHARALPGGTASGIAFNDNGWGGVYDRGAERDATYMHFDLSSLAGGTINGTVNLNFTIDATYGGAINSGVVGSATNAWSYPGTTGGITTISGADPSGNYSNGQTATAVIDNTTFQGFASNLGTFNGLAITAGAGSTAHFSGATLTGNATTGLVRVLGGTDWSAAAWNGGTSTLSISGASDVSGGSVTVHAGATVAVTDSATLGAGSFAGSFANSGILSFGSSANQTLSGVTSGSGSLSKSGAGTLTLSSINTYTGGTTVDGGILSLDGNGGNGRIKGALTVNANGTVVTTGDGTGLGYNNQLTALTINGGLVRTDGQDSHIWNITSGVSMTGGELQTNGGISSTSGNALQWNRTALTTNASANTAVISGRVNLRNDSGYTNWAVSVADGAASTDLLVSAAITGGGVNITKSDAGTMVLSGANTYTGQTNITAGTLVAANSTALGAGGWSGSTLTNISDGATLALQGNISLDEHMHLTGAGVGGLGALRSISGNNALTMTNANSGGGPGLAIDGNTTVGVDAGTLKVTGFYHDSGSFGITKVGAGTLAFTQSSSYTGGTTLQEGTINVSHDSALGTGQVTINGGAVAFDNAGLYEGLVSSSNSFDTSSPVPSGAVVWDTVKGHTTSNAVFANDTTWGYKGTIVVPGGSPVSWTFGKQFDDSVKLDVNGESGVINNNSWNTPVSATRTLQPGRNDIEVRFGQGGGGVGPNSGWNIGFGVDTQGRGTTNPADFLPLGNSFFTSMLQHDNTVANSFVLNPTTTEFLTSYNYSVNKLTGVLSGNGGLTKTGVGILTFANSMTYAGTTTVNGGTLRVENSSAAGSIAGAGPVVINSGGTLEVRAVDGLGYNNNAGTNGLTVNEGGKLTVAAGFRNSTDRNLNIVGGTVTSAQGVAFDNGASYTLRDTYNGGAGTNTYTFTSPSSGTPATLSAKDVGLHGPVTFNVTDGPGAIDLAVSGNLVNNFGTGSVIKAGSGTMTLTANNTYTGGTTINEGTVITGAGGVAMGAVTIASGATLSTTSAASTGLAALYYNNSVNQGNIASIPALLAHFGGNSPAPSLVQTATSVNFANNGSGFPSPYNSGGANFEAFYSGKINITSAGTYTFNTSSDDGSMLFIDGQAVVTNNFFQGVTTRTGTIALTPGMHDIVIAYNQGGGGYGMNAQMSGADNVNMVDINTANAAITPDLVVGSISGAGNVVLSTGNLITGIDNSSTKFSGVISGIGSLTKFGPGTLTLAGANSYTGATTVNGGTLKLQTGGTPILTDNFSATGNSNTSDLNYNLANRQTGSAATQNWTPTGNTQVGNPTNVMQPSGTNGDYLLLAFGAKANLAGITLSNGNVPGPLKINFDMFKGSTGNATEWTSFTLRTNGDGFPVAGSGELGFLYRNNTGIQIFNNGGLLQDFGSTAGGDSFGFYLADSAGTGSPFAGNGTRVIVTQGGSILGSYTLNTSMAASLIAFGSAGGMIGGVDNLGVNNFRTNVLDPATAVSLTASGAALELDGVIQTVASLSGVSGSAVNLGPFSRLTVNGANSTSFDGVIAGTFGSLGKDGSGTLTLTGANTYTGGTTVSGGTLEVSGSLTGTANVTVNTGGTLLLGGNGGTNAKLNTAATMNLAGGTLRVSDTIGSTLDQTLGTLTLSASSVIDFGTFASGNTFRFADSASLYLSWSGTLSIYNWTDGADHLFFGNGSGTGLEQSQLDQIKFFSDAGSTILPFAPGYSGFTGGFGEVAPVPEPSSVATAMGLLGLVGWRERRKAQSTRRASRK